MRTAVIASVVGILFILKAAAMLVPAAHGVPHFIDDAYYYIIIARNFAFGGIPSFDGLHATNGFHPLWMLLLTGMYRLIGRDADPFTQIVAAKALEACVLGIALAVVAVALLSGGRPRSGARLRGTSLLMALGSGVGFGVFYIALAHTSAEAGLWPLVAARVASVTAFSGALGVRRERPSRGNGGLSLMIATGVFDVTANALYVIAVHRGLLSIVAVLVSLYPASTVLCSLVFLGERLRALQVAGVALALGAVALITAG